ncbi:outer membrane protein assembly factor BamB family protein [Paenibacillus sp. IITD108]|uniref:outer membrane protein assembly factor BamB family protein n=1 Tax=Paenibacillus sp. IITD108 TaxID=3116649 RepID=UPI002F410280
MGSRKKISRVFRLVIALTLCLMIWPVGNHVSADQSMRYVIETWGNSVDGAVIAPPAIGADGTTYILTGKGKLYAFNQLGKERWRAEVAPARADWVRQTGQVTVGRDGVIYVGSGGNLYAFNNDGTQKWMYETHLDGFSKIVVQHNGLIYVSESLSLLGFRPDGTKALERTGITDVMMYSGSAEDIVYTFTSDNTSEIIGIKKENNNMLTFKSAYHVEQLNPSGTAAWKFKVDKRKYGEPQFDPNGNLILFTVDATSEELATSFGIGIANKPTEAIVISSGSIKHKYELDGAVEAPILFDDQQNAYFVTKNNNIAKYDAQGKQLWKLSISNEANVLEYGRSLSLQRDGTLLFFSVTYKHSTSSNGVAGIQPYQNKLVSVDKDGQLLSAPSIKYAPPAIWLDENLYLFQGFDQIILTDREGKQWTEYETGSEYYMTYIDEKHIYIGTDAGLAAMLEITSPFFNNQAIGITFGNIHTTFEVGGVYLLPASIRWIDDKERENRKPILYESSDKSVAYFANEELHAVSPGEATLTAKYNNLQTRINIKVVDTSSKPLSDSYHASLQKQWETELIATDDTSYERYWNPIIAADGTVYVHSSEGKLAAYDQAGTLKWKHDLEQFMTAKPVLGPDGKLYWGTNKRKLAVYETDTGKNELIESFGTEKKSTLLGWDANGNRYAGFTSNSHIKSGNTSYAQSDLKAVDKQGNSMWAIQLDGELVHYEPLFNKQEDTLFVIAIKHKPVDENESMTFGVRTHYVGTMYAINAGNGEIRWKYELDPTTYIYNKPIVQKDGSITTISYDGTITVLDSDGKLKWKKLTKVKTGANPLVKDDRLVFITTNPFIDLTSDEEHRIDFMLIDLTLQFVNEQDSEWLLTMKDIFSNAKSYIAAYNLEREKKWQLTVDGKNVYASNITDDYKVAAISENQRLTFYKVNVVHSPIEQAVHNPFSDMKEHWAEQQVSQLAATGVISGFPDGTFRPGAEVTREQYLAMLVKKLGIPAKARALAFDDVSAARWSRASIETAAALGWIDSDEASFKPNQPITREEAAVWTARALALTEQEDALAEVEDRLAIQSHYRGLIGAIIAKEIIMGYEDGSFKPKRTLSRAEAAVILNRLENKN